ncbi:Glycosyltransferase involved in cell wall bisynthesis [Evansella caseinilytica]|uniref:Glycosyltransferase involved in cell wall bisynthesis n=1 Tax=Evansella caseinilytica TaxID=1503961 RepID=A0A1H3U2A8_9BACI|nr:glycosyltransferase [Evansella caseinilytica]SDZ55659.1 Glycosyltransferase involved in cell wall bisynthesis [Evansella caseinilytica]
MKKIKILFFIYQMGGGGAARTLLNIINNLDRNKFSPVLVTLNYNGTYESEIQDDVAFIKLPTKRLSRSVFQLVRIIKNENIDLVFSTIPRVNTIAILAAKLSFTKVKTVVREADNLGGNWRTNLLLLGFGCMYKLSDQIVSLSEGVKENLVQRYKVKPTSIKVIYNPVDLEAIHEKIETGQVEPAFSEILSKKEKLIITAGRLVEQKDQKTLLRAFSEVTKKINSQLVILGEGPLKNELILQAKELNIQGCVHFFGFQSNPYVYLKNADLFVLSSKHEGFSHVIAEALATGTPVVSTECKSGPAEVLNNGEYGYLCAVGDADDMANKMLDILRLSKMEKKEMEAKGYSRASHFDAKKIVKQYEEVFEKVCFKP